MKKGLKILFVISFFISARAIAITPTDDTFVDELFGSNVNGSSPYLKVRCMNLNPGELDSLIKFDLANIPPEATIKSAILNLYYFYWADLDATGRQLDIYRITQDWSEDTATWNNRPAYNSTAIDTLYLPASYGWVQWDVTGSAQAFHDGTYPNCGWQIMDVETSGNSLINFYSNNYNTDPNLRPYLEITINIIFVDQNATGENDGSSWADAYTYLQDALAAAAGGDMIWVADGVYKPDEGAGKTPNDVNATFQLINSVKIYGGFAGNETAVKERDWENNLTILSGDIGLVDNNSDNSYHVVTGSSTNSTALLDGFTITDGNARGSFPQDRGGGMFINGGSPTLRNCTFTVNYASTEGGGIYHRYGSSPILANCRFNNNTAQYGGAICAYDNCDSKIINCTFTDNSADWWGGGLFLNFDCNPTVVNCIFIGNSAAEGGGMYNHTLSDPIVANCTFWDNSVDYYGGGICNEVSSDPIVRNCIVWANTSTYATVQDAQIYGGVPIVTFSCIQDSDPDDGSIPFGGAANNNIDDNPLFTDSANEDLRLSYNSPCVETANNTGVPADAADIDGDGVTIELVPRALDGRSRFIDGDCDRIETVDMGAYEFGWIYIGDLDGDCDIDLTDFAVTAKHWLEGK